MKPPIICVEHDHAISISFHYFILNKPNIPRPIENPNSLTNTYPILLKETNISKIIFELNKYFVSDTCHSLVYSTILYILILNCTEQ